MNVFIIAALTADGFIAQNSEHSPMNWTSKDDKRRFVELTKKAGVVVMGSKTFSTFPKPLKERLNIVYTRDPMKAEETYEKADNLQFTDIDPVELLKGLESKGYSSVAICGGSEIYTKFMKAGVVKKIYLTVEPVVFGTGVSLFKEPVEASIELVSTEKTETGTIFNEYNVK
jgi:dihydrofolate reductase